MVESEGKLSNAYALDNGKSGTSTSAAGGGGSIFPAGCGTATRSAAAVAIVISCSSGIRIRIIGGSFLYAEAEGKNFAFPVVAGSGLVAYIERLHLPSKANRHRIHRE